MTCLSDIEVFPSSNRLGVTLASLDIEQLAIDLSHVADIIMHARDFMRFENNGLDQQAVERVSSLLLGALALLRLSDSRFMQIMELAHDLQQPNRSYRPGPAPLADAA